MCCSTLVIFDRSPSEKSARTASASLTFETNSAVLGFFSISASLTPGDAPPRTSFVPIPLRPFSVGNGEAVFSPVVLVVGRFTLLVGCGVAGEPWCGAAEPGDA